MTDRELLEKAAKAAGIGYTSFIGGEHYRLLDHWNPLTDDGDALQLAVKLHLTVQQRDDHVKVGWQGCVQWIGEAILPCDEVARPKATRRAIVRAAAAMATDQAAPIDKTK
jgi:hypothetical protein